jgi:imidazole glycerol-phosphate synthase subunit HisF
VLRPRIIPSLLLKNGALVKTVGFSAPKYVGDPINAVRIFNEKEVDELVVLDIDASKLGAPPDFELIRRLAVECRMPLCYGGGVRSLQDFERIISLGVEKVAVGSAFVSNPDLVREAARVVGNQSVVVVLDARGGGVEGPHEVWTHSGTRRVTGSPSELARRAEGLGAGEILLNSISRDGTMEGYDLDLIASVRSAVGLPVTALGGAGSLTDIGELFSAFGVIGAGAGSLFVFKGKLRAVLISYPGPDLKEEIVSLAIGPPPSSRSC